MSDAGPPQLGERFRAAREARGASLSDVADQIRIRSVYLSAIEDEHWAEIGAPVYIRGFLRTYARYLRLDPEEAVAAFNATLPEPPAPRTDEPRARRPASGRGGLLLIWIAGTVAVLLVAFVVYNELTLRSQQSVATASATPTAAASASPSPPAPSPTPALGGASSLALVLSAPSWLRVTVDGNVSMEGTFPAGTSKTFHGKSALVRIGNAGGVEIYVDGKDRGKLGKAGDVVEQAFTL
jgi:cytoskeletal protein RodZ